MAQENFVPELHDIGKLVHENLKERGGLEVYHDSKRRLWGGHTFCDFKFEDFNKNYGKTLSAPISSPSWWGQFHHKYSELARKKKDEKYYNINEWDAVPKNYRVYLFALNLADHLASSLSRAAPALKLKATSPEGTLLKLWGERDRGKPDWPAFKDDPSKSLPDIIEEIFNEIVSINNGKLFLNKYEHNLLSTPEDKSFPRNITSLFTHVELVGKIFRLLIKSLKLTGASPALSVEYKYSKDRVQKVSDAENAWDAFLAKCWIRFPHSFVRLSDINIFKIREKLLQQLLKDFSDEALFYSPDFVMLFLLPETDLQACLKKVFACFLNKGFHIEIVLIKANLGNLTSNLDKKILHARKDPSSHQDFLSNNATTSIKKIYLNADIPEEISPPLCDICQLQKVKESPKEEIKEWVCDTCKEIRDCGEPFADYATWEAEGARPCWCKITLDQSNLDKWLKEAFEKYVNEFVDPATDPATIALFKEEFRPLAVQADFNKDYIKMLEEFEKKLTDLYYSQNTAEKEGFSEKGSPALPHNIQDSERPEEKPVVFFPIQGYQELFVFKYTPKRARQVLNNFLECYKKYFPRCTEEKAPISLSMSISNIKYPLREHWQYFDKGNKLFLNIAHQYVYEESFTLEEVEALKDKVDTTPKSSLYKLMQIYERLGSKLLLTGEILSNRHKNKGPYRLMIQGVSPLKLLYFYRFFWGDEGEEKEGSDDEQS